MVNSQSDLLVLSFGFAAWAVLHSYTASNNVKIIAERLFGHAWLDKWYRLTYNLFAAVSFLPVMWLVFILKGSEIYSLTGWLVWFARIVQAAMAIFLMSAVSQTGFARFIGFVPQSAGSTTEKTQGFVQDGAYAWVRHPIYTTSLIALWISPSMTSSSLLFCVLVTLYILIGIQFEERRLQREFGEVYTEYKKKEPMLIPFTKISRS